MRNFFHNISDILLAAVIVVIAAGVIFWRMNAILEYPEMMAGSANRSQVEAQADENGETGTAADDAGDTDSN